MCGRGREVVEVEAVIGESLIYSECDRISLTLRCVSSSAKHTRCANR